MAQNECGRLPTCPRGTSAVPKASDSSTPPGAFIFFQFFSRYPPSARTVGVPDLIVGTKNLVGTKNFAHVNRLTFHPRVAAYIGRRRQGLIAEGG
jgi:hypothetical protein